MHAALDEAGERVLPGGGVHVSVRTRVRALARRVVHVIAGYRLRPIVDEHLRWKDQDGEFPTRPVNMDARPLITIRAGNEDD